MRLCQCLLISALSAISLADEASSTFNISLSPGNVEVNDNVDDDVDVGSELEGEETLDLGSPGDVICNNGPFPMLGLPYNYYALEPHMDAQTLATHYSKHHLKYCKTLNEAILGTPFEMLTINQILSNLDPSNHKLRNSAGGYYNHNMFWDIMTPNGGGIPKGLVLEYIERAFGTFDAFKSQFNEAATSLFGSGWVWLTLDLAGNLHIMSTPNQDNPLMPNVPYKSLPIMGIDLWEHAYYLKHKDARGQYIGAFWNLIDWDKVNSILVRAVPNAQRIAEEDRARAAASAASSAQMAGRHYAHQQPSTDYGLFQPVQYRDSVPSLSSFFGLPSLSDMFSNVRDLFQSIPRPGSGPLGIDIPAQYNAGIMAGIPGIANGFAAVNDTISSFLPNLGRGTLGPF